MNLLKNRNKEFEMKLKDRLEGLEYKPSESVWDKILPEISDDEFENSVAEKVNLFEPNVKSNLWENIESKISVSGRFDLRKYLWIPLMLLFVGSSGYFGFNYFENNLRGEKKITVLNSRPDVKNENVIPENKKTKTEKVDAKKLNKNIISNHNKANVADKKILPVQNNLNSKINNSTSANIDSQKSPPNDLAQNNLPIANVDEPKNNISAPQNIEIKKSGTENAKSVVEEKSEPNNSENISTAKKDSAQTRPVEPIAKTDTSRPEPTALQKKTSNDELTKFSISALTGIHLCYNILVAPASSNLNLSENISLRKKIESPSTDWNGAFFLHYELNKKFRISSGIMVSNFSQQFYFDTLHPVATHTGINEPGVKMANQNDSITSGNSYNYRIKYTWTEIPLLVTWTFYQKKKLFDFEITGGVSYAFISGVDAAYVSYDNVGVLILTDKDAFPGIKNNFFFHFYPSVSYNINEKVSIGVVPTFKMSITSITGNDDWVQQYPYFIGISGTLRKKF